MTPEPDAKQRGIFERDKGSGTWWIQWFDAAGKRHREKVGARALAIARYRQRKHEALLARKFPQAAPAVLAGEWLGRISSQQLPRGVFERPKGSGVFWCVYFDRDGKRHREKAGSVAAAVLLHFKRKAGRDIDPAEVPALLALARQGRRCARKDRGGRPPKRSLFTEARRLHEDGRLSWARIAIRLTPDAAAADLHRAAQALREGVRRLRRRASGS